MRNSLGKMNAVISTTFSSKKENIVEWLYRVMEASDSRICSSHCVLGNVNLFHPFLTDP